MKLIGFIIVYILNAEVPSHLPPLGFRDAGSQTFFLQAKRGRVFFGESGPKGKT